MGLLPAEACADVLALAKEARKRNLGPLHPSFNVIKIIRDGLMRNLPENTHLLSSGRLCISLTRVSDGKNTLISNFNSKEEVVQALICSSFVPIYCGLIPPSFRGVRYVDGGISDNLPQYESKNTITVSPFAGECDICPKGNSANFHEMNVTNTSIQLSLGNLYRLTQALFPPEPKVLGEICEQGYSDAFKFLKENGILNDSIYVSLSFTKTNPHEAAQHIDYMKKRNKSENSRMETSQVEVLGEQMKQNPWPLEKSIFESLPPRLRKALQEACKEPNGFYAQFSKLFPVRVISYLMLPYTLPVESAYSAALRLVNWFPDMPADVRWMQEQLLQIAGTVYSQAKKRLFCTSRKDNYTALRKCQTAPATVEFHSSYCHLKMPHSSADIETWLWESSCYMDSVMKHTSPKTKEQSDLNSYPNFLPNSDESGLEIDFDSSSETSFQTAPEY
ncbi:patatin-like phospholipase domain-containing protein 2 isoform X2 [Gallus gallus]|uniref:patatin-like phospholipase domain-containing protein 2 isoform X2 n=1 Tax=Gallus gallus TaxID=9031 RepID=UPI000739ABB8|nr:patatin-like phospholipase domain-containing protein 2 isoform X2 [Gallus gallus]XP_046771178.1 patatin-like phospholipase domain-containing protein 2 isoform X2 [Gallus gallus]XP_046771181.1 patatin-like phospholipase domain-containing protein 2 isoform X2 [Gallus gallus]XP_046771182.1 patatin-like phospholipase domain-containing protein 2 isoform X2 [Gallus gallus]XP_046771183.1 patatin-like phospholipase domain-containing protein 2 isoform X2 [Gallus gallus]|eukprot:XP_015146675.1 patatin-like phospholipase domain-containing protein 2 isoform X3 [Gallus gallus]